MAYARKLETHYANIWGTLRERGHPKQGPVHGLPDDFGVLLFDRQQETLAYATVCMSQPSDEQRIELHIITRDLSASRDVVELLATVAQFHRTTQPLDLGHTVNFGRPWQEGSACTHGLVSLPYLDGPELEHVHDPLVRCLWLLPVTASEVTYKKEHGLDALEQRFEDRPFDSLDPLRASVV